jgi:hypothetical protein
LLEPPVAYRADTLRGLALAACASLPIWSCSVWGLPCLTLYSVSGALLPHLFTLTPAGLTVQANLGPFRWPCPVANDAVGVAEAVSSLWHWPSLSLEAQIPDVIRHTALRSSDFPPLISPHSETSSDRPAPLLYLFYPHPDFRFGRLAAEAKAQSLISKNRKSGTASLECERTQPTTPLRN